MREERRVARLVCFTLSPCSYRFAIYAPRPSASSRHSVGYVNSEGNSVRSVDRVRNGECNV